MQWSLEGVVALAPDDASAKAARGLTSAGKWPLLGANDAAAWGECQGSGSKPYQTQVDFNGPAFRCSCPSRKFPCKHGLALLMMRAQDESLFKATDAPAWVNEWLASRHEKAQKQEERQREKASAPPPDPQAVAKREAQRWQRMTAAGEELQRWLADQLARGLGALNDETLRTWHTMAARMVDAQAPGLAFHVREAAQCAGRGVSSPERLLHRLGVLQLLCDALLRREQLSPDQQADLQSALGWPQDKAEVLASGPRVNDRWTVLGIAVEERDDKLTERRVWLHGQQTGRRACLLDHAFGGRGFEQSWLVGTGVEGALAFFPGAAGVRALWADAPAVPGPAVWPVATPAEERLAIAQRVSACPWTGTHPRVLANAIVMIQGPKVLALSADEAVPLHLGEHNRWQLMASTGGRPCQLMGEWDGEQLVPLTAWLGPAEGVLWQRGAE